MVSTQCSETAKNTKVMGMVTMVHRQFKDLDKESFILLYKTLIRPHIEFAIPALSLYLKRDIECLEKDQRRAIKIVK